MQRTFSHSKRKTNHNCQFLYKKTGTKRHDTEVHGIRLDVRGTADAWPTEGRKDGGLLTTISKQS